MSGEPYCAWCNKIGHAASVTCEREYRERVHEPKTDAEIADRMQQSYDVTGDIWYKRAADRLRVGPAAAAGSAVAMREALLTAQAALSDGAFTGPMVDASLKQIEAALAAPQAQEGEPDNLNPVRVSLRTIAVDLRACVAALGEGDDLGAVLTGYADAADAVLNRASVTRPMRGGE